MPEHNQAAAHKSNLACGCRAAAVSLVGAVALYRPLVSGVTPAPASTSAFGLLLLTASLLWLGSELLRGQLQVRFGPAALVFSIFMAVAFASSVRAENWFAGLHWWLLLATYGLTAFLILQLADTEQERSFLMSCLLATAVALAAYGLWHYVLYMPAVRRWLAADPLLFQAVSGAVGPLADDLGARVASNRAYGSFLGPNQLANFLAISFFPLLALVIGGWLARKGEAKRSAADWIVLAIGCAGAALMLAMLYLTGSKGGWISLLVGAAILVWCSPRRLLVGAAIAAALVLVAYLATAMPKPAPLDASLGVRFGYWRTSLDIAGERPVLGVGPGSWPDWYAMLKQPEFEETQDPHCLYLQVLAETGVAGLVLCLAFWAVLLISALEHSGGRMFEILPERGERSGGTAPARGLLAGMGLGAAALALAFDYATVGTFHPPEQVPAWLGAAPWLPYVLIYAVWSGAFLAFFRGAGGGQVALSPWAMTAALSVFLVHSAVERTLSVPAIGSTVAVLAALLLATSRLPLQRKAPVQATTALLIFVAALVMVALWGVGPTRWAVQAALGRNASDNLRAEALAQDQAP
ncbi:MAG: O-antigen ligase family protein, partial [Planctomycetota bacterium]